MSQLGGVRPTELSHVRGVFWRNRWPDLALNVLVVATLCVGGLLMANFTGIAVTPQGLGSRAAGRSILAGFALCAFAMLWFFWQYASVGDARKRWLSAIETNGTVTGVEHGLFGGGGQGAIYMPVVRYSAAGAEREGSAALWTERRPRVGSEVALRYDPQDPDWFVVESSDPAKSLRFSAGFTIGLAVWGVGRMLIELVSGS